MNATGFNDVIMKIDASFYGKTFEKTNFTTLIKNYCRENSNRLYFLSGRAGQGLGNFRKRKERKLNKMRTLEAAELDYLY